MIKIVKEGNIDHREFFGQCRKCQCRFTCHLSDVITSFDRNESLYSIACPHCNAIVWVNEITGERG